MEMHGRAGRGLDRGRAALQIALQLRAREAQLQLVAMTMQRQRVALVEDPSRQLWAPLHLLTDHKEGRACTGGSEDLEDRRRALWMGPVVERDRNRRARAASSGPSAGQRPRDRESGRGGR